MSNILSAILPNFFSGLVFLILLFLICLFLVVGGKVVYLAIKARYLKKKKPAEPVIKKASPIPTRKRKTSRTISINPDEVDKIYFKKIS